MCLSKNEDGERVLNCRGNIYVYIYRERVFVWTSGTPEL